MLFLIVLSIAAVILYRKLKSKYRLLDELNINHPKPVPLFGNVGEFKDKCPLDVFKAWRNVYGKVFGFYEGLRPSIVVCDPVLIQQILVKQFDKFQSRPLCTPFQNRYEELGILNTHGELWKQQRHVVATCFNTTSMNQMIQKMIFKSNNLVEKLGKESTASPDGFEIAELLDRHMLDIFAYSAFDYDSDSLNNTEEIMYKYMVEFSKVANTENPVPGIARLFPALTPLCQYLAGGKFRDAHETQLKQLTQLVEKERTELLNDESNEKPNIIRKLLRTTASCKDENNNTCKRYLSNEEVLAQLTSMVTGGLDAAAAVTSFLVYCLAMYPDIQHKVQDEMKEVFQNDDEITLDKLSSLPYLDMVLNETQRFYPVTPGVARYCTEDVTIDGIQFKQGMPIKIMTCVMNQDKEIFPEPDKFIPERFSKQESEKRHPMSWLPFGAGPKMCVGVKLGLLKCKLTVVQILRNYHIETSSETEIPIKTKLHPILAPKNGVHIKLVPRISKY
ncbi:hypothetical protein LOTGIDRAFT_170488 [Lottia gigantea]|uniref:Cytochrome P450 n=1 Tax=Lottia gigantea TaxID=225164 RepID=V3YVF7_LOTGI|nr:hypothetical protein LOTGIDRAFT_170488 [Lottia gigantea]ESO81948.1 hypothetical protein LOTGIDRAFT_170488 [Lottia gigantea]